MFFFGRLAFHGIFHFNIHFVLNFFHN
jgi:hypothetical protein